MVSAYPCGLRLDHFKVTVRMLESPVGFVIQDHWQVIDA